MWVQSLLPRCETRSRCPSVDVISNRARQKYVATTNRREAAEEAALEPRSRIYFAPQHKSKRVKRLVKFSKRRFGVENQSSASIDVPSGPLNKL